MQLPDIHHRRNALKSRQFALERRMEDLKVFAGIAASHDWTEVTKRARTVLSRKMGELIHATELAHIYRLQGSIEAWEDFSAGPEDASKALLALETEIEKVKSELAMSPALRT